MNNSQFHRLSDTSRSHAVPQESVVNLKCRLFPYAHVGAPDSLPIFVRLDIARQSAQLTGLPGKWRRRAADFLQLGRPSILFVLEVHVLCAIFN